MNHQLNRLVNLSPKMRDSRFLGYVQVAAIVAPPIYRGYVNFREKRKKVWTLRVSEKDSIYKPTLLWLSDVTSIEKCRDFRPHIDEGSFGGQSHLQFVYDFESSEVVVEGHPIEVSVGERRPTVESEGFATLIRGDDYLTFTAKSKEGIDALKRKLIGIIDTNTSHIYSAARWGDWQIQEEIPNRPMGTVVLAEGVMESILADLDLFIESEQDYVRLGIPWHRGLLFHGPPGSGKTSIARALSNHYGFNIYYMPLSEIDTDTTLLNRISSIRPNSVLLLEDIDKLAASRSDETQTPGQTETKVTTAGLLNALDGLMTPHGLITIMTTNHPEKFDWALRRPGRVDLDLEIGYVDTVEQAQRLVNLVHTGIKVHDVTGSEISAAAIAEACKVTIRKSPAEALPAFQAIGLDVKELKV